MKTITLLLALFLWPLAVFAQTSAAPGFTDSDVLFYGEVRQVSGAQTSLLQSGQLKLTFVNQNDPENRVTVETSLSPTGPGQKKNFSYSLKVPLAYLPSPERRDEYLSIGADETIFEIQEITIDGRPATLPDGSVEFYGFSFASRSADHRLDLIVGGEIEDLDGDGLPDWWERLHGLNPSLADADDDLDSDGWSNLKEFRIGSDPSLSNRDPQLATGELFIPESGVAGIYLHVFDSDTAPDDISLELSGSQHAGFQVLVDGEALAPGETEQCTLADLQSGRFCINHLDRSNQQFNLPVSWNDGGEIYASEVVVTVITPSTGDGNDSTLWLDGNDLGENGSPISNWSDRSGNARSVSQPSAQYQPLVRDHSVDFSKSSSAHLFFSDLAIPSGNHTVLASYRTAETSDASQTLLSTNRGYLNFTPTTQAVSYSGASGYQIDGIAVRGYQNASGQNSTSIFRKEGELLQNVFGLSYDGQNIAATSIDPVLPTIGGRRLAIPGSAKPVIENFGGQLQELLVFPSALPEQKLRDVHDYLQSKWGDAVIWDLSTELRGITLSGSTSLTPQIIRGGHGDDILGGGSADDTLSGGPGADSLSGGPGSDRFVFGGVDTGADEITDFDVTQDIVDLSALFWGQTGDARDFLTVRLDADFATEIPTLDSVLIVQLPSEETLEITLKNTVVGSDELIQLIVEGRISMGGLSIPSNLQLSLASGPQGDSFEEPFKVVLTRSGDGVSGALDIPIGFFEDAIGGHFVIDEATTNDSRRAVVHFARGETEKTLTVRPLPDLETTGSNAVEVAVLPSFKYTVVGSSVERVVTDQFNVWLEVIQPNAVSDLSQPASVRIHRDDDLSESFTIGLQLGGTAQEGVHIESMAKSLTIPVGQSYQDILFNARAEGLLEGPKVVVLQLASGEAYQLGNPNEALLYVGATIAETNSAGFDRWLLASTEAAMTSLSDLSNLPSETVNRYLQAYAYGLDSVDGNPSPRITFQIVDGKPEISTHTQLKFADVGWRVESAAKLNEWLDQSAHFTGMTDATGSKFVGETLSPEQINGFYRLSMNLDAGVYSNGNIAAVAGTDNFATSGSATWTADEASGDLTSSGGDSGKISRIIAQLDGEGSLDFEMEITGGDGNGVLAFYIDGVKQSETSGKTVAVEQTLSTPGNHLLMWQFTQGTGNAVIRNMAK